MHGWLPILIMIGLGAGFGILNVRFQAARAEETDARKSWRRTNAACRRSAMPASASPVKFYLVAMIFLLFDIEVAFLYPLAMALRELRWSGFMQLLTFFASSSSGYVYVWRKGVLDWAADRPRCAATT